MSDPKAGPPDAHAEPVFAPHPAEEINAHKSTSTILVDLVRTHPKDRISIRELLLTLGERGFGIAFVLFSIPAAMPGPPGFGSLFGIPLMIFAAQMVMRRPAPWLPAFIADRGFGRADLERIILLAVPYMKRVERLTKPRLEFLLGGIAEILLGLLIFVYAFILFLPGPGTNFLPGLSILVLAIALIERDGLLLLAGILISFVLMAFAVWGVWLFIVELLPLGWNWLVNLF